MGKNKTELFLSDGMTAEKFRLLGLDKTFVPMGLDELVGAERGIKTADFTGLTLDKKEIERLLVDLLDNKPKLNEATAGVQYQSYFGVKLTRPTPEYNADGTPKAGFDYWVDGKQKLDFMLTMHGYPQRKIDNLNKYFAHTDDAWLLKQKQIIEHLEKADIVPIDLRYLTTENRLKIIDFVLSLSTEQQQRVIFITGEL